MENYKPEQVINGTFGEIWVNGEYIAEATGIQAKITLEKTEVNQARTLTKGYKTTGIDCKGTLKLNKVSSFFIKLLSEDLKKGKATTAKIMSNVKDPDAFGAERVILEGCTFDELTLADWEVKKLGEESVPFTFTSWEPVDLI